MRSLNRISTYRKTGRSILTAVSPRLFSSNSSASATATAASSPESNTSSSSSEPRVLIERLSGKDEGIVHVYLNRTSKMNGLDVPMFDSIAAAAQELRADRSVRVVILSGKGRAFCTGLDVKAVMSSPKNFSKLLHKPAGTPVSNLAQDVGYLWRQLPCPVIAAVHGMCFGGGLQIALGADMRVSTPDCQWSVMEAKWGIIPDMSASVTMRELLRVDIAKELTMTGRVFSGREAQEYGLVTKLSDDPLASSLSLAREILARNPDAVAATKRLFHSTFATGASEAACLETETQLQLKLLPSWNQASAAGRSAFGVNVPYVGRKDLGETAAPPAQDDVAAVVASATTDPKDR